MGYVIGAALKGEDIVEWVFCIMAVDYFYCAPVDLYDMENTSVMGDTYYMVEVYTPSTPDAKKSTEDDVESLHLVDRIYTGFIIVESGIRGLIQ